MRDARMKGNLRDERDVDVLCDAEENASLLGGSSKLIEK
jgi:hypothetical protein